MRLRFAIALALTPSLGLAQTYACQYLAAAGLEWQNNRWEQAGYKPREPFFLHAVGGELTKESVSKVIKINPSGILCFEPYEWASGKEQMCSSIIGEALLFSFRNEKGGVARLNGAGSSDAKRDSLFVSPFTCQKVSQ